MKIHLSLWQKMALAAAAFAVAIPGFMIKLPSVFSHYDKQLHSLFYFLAAGFLNILFAKRSLLIHAFIFAGLYAFGMAIEYAQQYSNTYFQQRIHGNADPEDIHANLTGLIAFSSLWMVYLVIAYIARPGNDNTASGDIQKEQK